jgi:hypothetical protein
LISFEKPLKNVQLVIDVRSKYPVLSNLEGIIAGDESVTVLTKSTDSLEISESDFMQTEHTRR